MTAGRYKKSAPLSPLADLFREAESLALRRSGLALSREQWKAVAGLRIAQHSEPGPLRGGALIVWVDSPLWSTELSFLSDTILTRLRELGLAVRQLRFQTRALTPSTPVVRPPPRPKPLPPEVEAHTRRIEDPDLRASVERAAAANLSLGNAPKPDRRPR